MSAEKRSWERRGTYWPEWYLEGGGEQARKGGNLHRSGKKVKKSQEKIKKNKTIAGKEGRCEQK